MLVMVQGGLMHPLRLSSGWVGWKSRSSLFGEKPSYGGFSRGPGSSKQNVQKMVSTARASADPLLVQAARGEAVERPPAWMMRQAGRYMAAYREVAAKHPSFRERSETTDLIVEISLQPWRAFHPDGVIIFSDILTPLPAFGIPFDIDDVKGPIIHSPIRTEEGLKTLHHIELDKLQFVGDSLEILRKEVGNQVAVLGFVGAPWTLATYIIEGGTSRSFTTIKTMCHRSPGTLRALLSHLAQAISEYIVFQVNSGAQCIQIFDSWGGQITPNHWDLWSKPYIKQVFVPSAVLPEVFSFYLVLIAYSANSFFSLLWVIFSSCLLGQSSSSTPNLATIFCSTGPQIVSTVRTKCPGLPLVLYINGNGGLLERMRETGVDIIGLDWTVDMADARQRLGDAVGVQGNVDPALLFGPLPAITEEILRVVNDAGRQGHILNLGHGVLVGTPEEAVAHFFDVSRSLSYDSLFVKHAVDGCESLA